jgi:hypothetical protein
MRFVAAAILTYALVAFVYAASAALTSFNCMCFHLPTFEPLTLFGIWFCACLIFGVIMFR